MYNRYIQNDNGQYRPIPPVEPSPIRPQEPCEGEKESYNPLSGLLERLNLRNFDSGDLLLLAIIFLLLREKGDEDLLIALLLLFIL